MDDANTTNGSNGFKEYKYCDWCGLRLKWGRNYYKVETPQTTQHFCRRKCAEEFVDTLIEGFVNE